MKRKQIWCEVYYWAHKQWSWEPKVRSNPEEEVENVYIRTDVSQKESHSQKEGEELQGIRETQEHI